MSKNKLIFLVLGVIIVVLIFLLVFQLNKSTQDSRVQKKTGDLTLWVLHESVSDIESFITTFKQAYPKYENVSIEVETFSNRDTYKKALTKAMFQGVAPDIFMLHNLEYSVLDDEILGLNPALVSPNDFRVRFHPVFAQDLIVANQEDEQQEFVRGVPVGFQTPALLYNRRNFPSSENLLDWGRFLKDAQRVVERYNMPPLAIGDGKTVGRITSSINTFFTHNNLSDIIDISGAQGKQAFSYYTLAGDIEGGSYLDMTQEGFAGKMDIDYFAEGSVAAMLGYPRDLNTIASIGYQNSLLFASPFPYLEGQKVAHAIDYDYFVIYKNTASYELAADFLTYIFSEDGQRAYLDIMPHYIPAASSLLLEFQERKVHPSFNVVYKNFLHQDAELISFKAQSYEQYTQGLRNIFDGNSAYDTQFEKLRAQIICSVGKYTRLENLSSPCE